jgi:hypothetical protein
MGWTATSTSFITRAHQSYRALPSASRSLLKGGPDTALLRQDLERLGEEFRILLVTDVR